MKRALLWISFLAYLIGAMMAAVWWVARPLAKQASGPIDFNGILICGAVILSVIGSIFLADVLWLLTWRYLATRKEIMEVAGSYPLTQLDRWLIRTLGPQL